MRRVTIVDADDWQGLYVDNVLELEGHRLPLNHVLKILGITVDYHQANSDWLDDHGGFPEEFKDVVIV